MLFLFEGAGDFLRAPIEHDTSYSLHMQGLLPACRSPPVVKATHQVSNSPFYAWNPSPLLDCWIDSQSLFTPCLGHLPCIETFLSYVGLGPLGPPTHLRGTRPICPGMRAEPPKMSCKALMAWATGRAKKLQESKTLEVTKHGPLRPHDSRPQGVWTSFFSQTVSVG